MKQFPKLNDTMMILVNEGNGQFHWDARRYVNGKVFKVEFMPTALVALGVLNRAS